MEFTALTMPGLYLIRPDVFGDRRGWFAEVWNQEKYRAMGLDAEFVQDNQSFTAAKGTLRGLHFQLNPMSQLKLTRVNRGAALDVVVDLRKGSPTYLKWEAVELSQENRLQLWVPRGFAHGFVTLTDQVEFCYKVDNPYAPSLDRTIRFDDPQIAVDWGVSDPLLSDKDRQAPFLKDSDVHFVFEGCM